MTIDFDQLLQRTLDALGSDATTITFEGKPYTLRPFLVADAVLIDTARVPQPDETPQQHNARIISTLVACFEGEPVPFLLEARPTDPAGRQRYDAKATALLALVATLVGEAVGPKALATSAARTSMSLIEEAQRTGSTSGATS